MHLTFREFQQVQQIIAELQSENLSDRFEILEESNGIGSVIRLKIPYQIKDIDCFLLFEIADTDSW